jgi:hypothetical protein
MLLHGHCVSADILVLHYGAQILRLLKKANPTVVEDEAPFQEFKRFWNEEKCGHQSRRVSKPRITVLVAGTSRNVMQ